MITAEVSLYPVDNVDSDYAMMNSLQDLSEYDLQQDIGSLSTQLSGDPSQVWAELQSLFSKAQSTGHEVVMVVTVSNNR